MYRQGEHSTCQSTAQTTFTQRSVCEKFGTSSLRGIRADLFDVVFTILEQQAVLPHYFYYPIAPNKMSALPLTHEQALEHLGIQNAEQTITILIGADTKTVKIGEAAQWANVLQQVRKQYPTARLLLTTSRRTSVTFEKNCRNLPSSMAFFSPMTS